MGFVAQQRLEEEYDVAVIGGGLYGLAVARDCAMRRLKVIVFEARDFGVLSSDASSGLLAGEPERMLDNADISRRACREIAVWQRLAPNLLQRTPLLFPVLEDEAPFALAELEALAKIYAPLNALKESREPVRVSREDLLQLEPNLTRKNRGGVIFDEWIIDSRRLSILMAKAAAAAGALLVKPARVIAIEATSGKIHGVEVAYQGAKQRVKTTLVVNAAGPSLLQANDLIKDSGIEVTRTHFSRLLYERPITNTSIALNLPSKERLQTLLSAPWGGWLGPHSESAGSGSESPEEALARERAAIASLVTRLKRYVPNAANHRPIDFRTEVREELIWSELPRKEPKRRYFDHSVQHLTGLITVMPGRINAARTTAESITDIICRVLKRRERCRTHLESLPGCTSEIPWKEEARRTGRDPAAINALIVRQGYNARRILDEAARSAEMGLTLCECQNVLAAEVAYCVENEWVDDLEDLERRLRWGEGSCSATRCMHRTSSFLGKMLNWEPARLEEERVRYHRRKQERLRSLFGEAMADLETARWVLRTENSTP